ncbi:hypothetical protein [Halomarina pelagica]|uniref:hypothetical protein n=1 Tax=Halomarina pelagica TaxID=2961599 RepID=UPI0020C29077|nr:hypothetical protein [Halomarina sp. BND7]
MDEHRATLEIESKADALAVSGLLYGLHDRLREEHSEAHGTSTDTEPMLDAFESLRRAVERGPGGRVTITYEAGPDAAATDDRTG